MTQAPDGGVPASIVPAGGTSVRQSQGTQFGDGNLQVNLFTGEPPRGPVIAGNVPQASPAFRPRDDLMASLRAHGPGGRVDEAILPVAGQRTGGQKG